MNSINLYIFTTYILNRKGTGRTREALGGDRFFTNQYIIRTYNLLGGTGVTLYINPNN